jgi:DNA mismatch repair protein MutS2
MEKGKNELEQKMDKIEAQKDKVIRDAQREALEIVKKSKQEAEILIKELREAIEKEAADKAALIEKTRLKIKHKQDEIEEKIGEAVFKKVSHNPPKNLKLGDTVKILSLNQKGYVLTLPDSEGNLMVQAGIMKINANINNLKLDNEEEKQPIRTGNKSIQSSKARSVSTQIDVRGQLLEEAMMNVDKFIDDAYLANVGQATIIHGKGTGILRAGITQLLKSHVHVKAYRSGGFNEGGIGATIVEIK